MRNGVLFHKAGESTKTHPHPLRRQILTFANRRLDGLGPWPLTSRRTAAIQTMTDLGFLRELAWCSIGDWIGANRAGWRRLLKTIRSCARFAFALGMPEAAATGLRKAVLVIHTTFSTEILYGSDWFMPMIAGSDRVNCLNAFKAAILDVGPNGASTEFLYKNFFYRNALAFLDTRNVRLAPVADCPLNCANDSNGCLSSSTPGFDGFSCRRARGRRGWEWRPACRSVHARRGSHRVNSLMTEKRFTFGTL